MGNRSRRWPILLAAGALALVSSACALVVRVSVPDGNPNGDGQSLAEVGSLGQRMGVSADGRFVLFTSTSANLVPGDTNGVADFFLRDRQAGTTTRPVPSIPAGWVGDLSPDGRYLVVFSGGRVYRHDRTTGTTSEVAPAQNATSAGGAVSTDGRFVAFSSQASNLVAGDTNGVSDIFVRDFATATITRVSVATGGAQATGGGVDADVVISADGRFVAFSSTHTNLVGGDTNGRRDVFVHDRTLVTTFRVSLTVAGTQVVGGSLGSLSPSITDDGRVVAFESDGTNIVAGDDNGRLDVFERDVTAATTIRRSPASGGDRPRITRDGEHLAFRRSPTTTVRIERSTGTEVVTSRADTGAAVLAGNHELSDDGSIAVFETSAAALADDTNSARDVYARDVGLGRTERVSRTALGTAASAASARPALSGDGRYVAFTSSAANLVARDVNGVDDVFVRDQLTGSTTRESVSTGDLEGNGASTDADISDDGRYVTFSSTATNLVGTDTNGTRDVFVRDRSTGFTTRVSVATGGGQGNDFSGQPAISADGRYVAFASSASNLVAGDVNGVADIFVHDRTVGVTVAVTPLVGGVPASRDPDISGDGSHVAFVATDTFVPGVGLVQQIGYARNPLTGPGFGIALASRPTGAAGGALGNASSFGPSLSHDGRLVAYDSDATNLVTGDTNGTADVFVTDVSSAATGAVVTTRVSLPTGSGGQSNGFAINASIAGDGRYVTFDSNATDLGVVGPNSQVYVRDRTANRTTLVSTAPLLAPGDRDSTTAALSRDGAFAAIVSAAQNFTEPPDPLLLPDVFVAATQRPSITAFSPPSVMGGTTVPFTITGTGFRTPLDVTASPRGARFTITAVTDTSITGTVTVGSGAAVGLRELKVTNLGTAPWTAQYASQLAADTQPDAFRVG